MSTPTTHSTLPPEDVDLLVLLERLVLYFRKNLWPYLIAIVAGGALGFFTWLKLPKVYKSRMVIHSFTLSNLDYIQVVANWNRLLNSGEHAALAETLGMQRNSIGKVKSIKGSEIQKVFSTNNPNGFTIDVYVTDNAVLGQLQQGFLTGFENVDFIRKQLILKKNNLKKLITEVTKEITKLDSIKSKVTTLLDDRSGQSSSLMVDITGLNRQRIDLNEKLLYYQQDLEMATAVQVIQGFSTFNRPAGPRLLVWLGLGMVAGGAVAFVITLFNAVWKRAKLRLQQHT